MFIILCQMPISRNGAATVVRRLTPSLVTTLAFAYLLTAVWFGMWLRRFIPPYDLSPDSRDTVKLAMGLVVTMSALVLGLLVDSTKGFYDRNRTRVMETASKCVLLHRMLSIYGPKAAEVRGALHGLIEEMTRRMWSDDADNRAEPTTRISDDFYVAVLRLEAHDDTERTLKAQAISLTNEIAQVRSLMLAESIPSISTPMLIMLVHWLVMIFFSASLIAPASGTADLALISSALCVAGAIFLILELDRPFNGFLRISREPMLNVLRLVGPS